MRFSILFVAATIFALALAGNLDPRRDICGKLTQQQWQDCIDKCRASDSTLSCANGQCVCTPNN
ncbi:hypothetical protein HYALB_00009408 [Hymenoscyphus albidus]|uniref:Extracellular membrane protein CFEM domain-containing protein n=1 Tax=Hymenoscyphus albidus TaxID=595503 RepID=A0A9N9LLA4_9HELO|nr:hypothetical protein HYALB_00009408 [Hymenoscyphus albidus]